MGGGNDSTRFVGGSSAPDNEESDLLVTDQDCACVVVVSGEHQGAEFQLDTEDTYTIGRDRSAQIWILDEAMSRRHAAVVVEGDQYFLRDLDSTNGTHLGGQLLKGISKPLQDGDRFKVGETQFQFLAAESRPEHRVEAGRRPPARPAPKGELPGEASAPEGAADDDPLSTDEDRESFGQIDDLLDTGGFADRPEDPSGRIPTGAIEPLSDDED